MPLDSPSESSPSSLARLRDDSRAIFAAGVAAVDPMVAVQRAVVRRGDTLIVDGVAYDLQRFAHIYVVGTGKGSAVMAQGLEAILGDRISAGAVTVKYEHVAPVERVTLYEAAHPIPDAAGMQGANAAMELVRQAGDDDLVFCLLSGGGSALWPAPSAGITLGEKQRMTGLLIDCGARIDEINVIRKHLSAVKGGPTGAAGRPGTADHPGAVRRCGRPPRRHLFRADGARSDDVPGLPEHPDALRPARPLAGQYSRPFAAGIGGERARNARGRRSCL